MNNMGVKIQVKSATIRMLHVLYSVIVQYHAISVTQC